MKNQKKVKRVINLALEFVFCLSLIVSVYAMSGQTAAPNLDTASTWAHEGINNAVAFGIVPHSLQNYYTSNATRAEFAALAVALYETVIGMEITGRMDFNDTSDINVRKVGYLGVVEGVGGGNFAPDNTLTREQAAVMLARLANVMGQPIPPSAPTFADNAQISSWAVDAVGQMQAAGIMGGTGNNQFTPRGDYTREQSIVTMLRLLSEVESVPEPTPTPTPAPTPAPISAAELFERRVFELTNAERARRGVAALIWDDSLADEARANSYDLAVNDSHWPTNSDGTTFDQRIRNLGFTGSIGKNMISGGTTPEYVVRQWTHSPAHSPVHWNHILNADFTHVGVGFAEVDGRIRVTQKFAQAPQISLSITQTGASSDEVTISQGGTHPRGSTVNISATANTDDLEFVEWQVTSGNVTITDPRSPNTTVILRRGNNAGVRAVFVRIVYFNVTSSQFWTGDSQGNIITADGYPSSLAMDIRAGSSVTLSAIPAEGQRFVRWNTPNNATIADINSQTTVLIFDNPNNNAMGGTINITAVFESIPPQ